MSRDIGVRFTWRTWNLTTHRIDPDVDEAVAAQQKNTDWATYGLDYYEQRFSTLDQINDTNAAQLGLAWQFDTATDRGLEATPLIIDGVMYATGSWSVTYAVDARTGKQLWKYDPEVHRKYDNLACCDVVNRGAAFYKDKVYVGVLDGRLVSLEGAPFGLLPAPAKTVQQTANMIAIVTHPETAPNQIDDPLGSPDR